MSCRSLVGARAQLPIAPCQDPTCDGPSNMSNDGLDFGECTGGSIRWFPVAK